jgi:hypothetical protein
MTADNHPPADPDLNGLVQLSFISMTNAQSGQDGAFHGL